MNTGGRFQASVGFYRVMIMRFYYCCILRPAETSNNSIKENLYSVQYKVWYLRYMNAVSFLENQIPKFLSANILVRELVTIPSNAAKVEDINAEELKIGLSFSNSYRRLLQKWNGLNLDVIRFLGVGNVSRRIYRVHEWQIPEFTENFLFIANDPAGFAFAENKEGHIYSFDNDGGDVEMICTNFDTFVIDYLFGKDSIKFMGEEWLAEITALN